MQKKSSLAALIGSLALISKSTMVLFDSLKSMTIQDCMMGNCILALINIREHHTNIYNGIISII
jgi:hypothetical protein